uniref:Transposase (Putative), gypsy type n=1 Tax=Tanacetum cinerariifolium TaxID=118510 RepID=A0A699GS03_TANCI|nr:hypothetical protein [Tanacetum cinerariifolium]
MGRDTIQFETVVSTISQEYLLEFTSEYGISDDLHPKLPGREERIVDFLEGKVEDQGPGIVAPKVPPLENIVTMRVALEAGLVEERAVMGPHAIKECRERGNDESTIGGKSLAAVEIGMRDKPVDVSDPNPLSFADPQSIRTENGVAVAGDLKLEHNSFTFMVGSPESIYQSEWGVTNGFRLDALDSATRKSIAKVARRDKRIQARENEINNLEAMLEATTDMKKTAEAKSIKLGKELERFSDLQVSNDRLSLWVIGHGLCLVVMKCDESTELRHMFVDVVSAGIAKGMSEGLKFRVEHRRANLDLEPIEVYDPEANAKYVATLHGLRDLKYPMAGQVKILKDAPIAVILASLHLESDTLDDALQWIRELRPSSYQLKIHVYLECLMYSVGVFSYAPDILGTCQLRSQSPRPLGLQPVYAAGML